MTRPLPPLELIDASISYNGRPVLSGLNHVFPARTVTCVVGPSGEGKSTLLRTLCRLNDRIEGFRVQGQVRVKGVEIYSGEDDVHGLRRRVGMVFQNPCVFPISILENAVFGYRHHFPGGKKEWNLAAERVLREVGLWEEVKDRLHKPAPTLSQGQRQRLAMARTLAVDPEILLMDEPTSALDPQSSAGIEDLIGSLKTRHAIVVVTHNLGQARRIADEVIFLNQGTVWESGGNPDFFLSPQKEETLRYLATR